MTVSSMTGYARAEGAHESVTWHWEARSVNSKGLDVRCRVPSGYDAVDVAARDAVGKTFKRGSVSLALQVDRGERRVELTVNAEALEQVLALQASLASKVDQAPPRLETLLSVRGMAETVEQAEDEDVAEAREEAVRTSLEMALKNLKDARDEEGARLLSVLKDQLQAIERLTKSASQTAEAQPAILRARLESQVAELLEAKVGVAEERLAQEAAMLATRADVREEIDRLHAHIEAAAGLLKNGGVIGRKLDFLCQEFNREANTLCSKAADIELTRIGLDLKATIEQFREQVQNVE